MWFADELGFPKSFSYHSGELGCTRPCAYYSYKPRCEKTEKGGNTHAEMLKEKGDDAEANVTAEDDFIRVLKNKVLFGAIYSSAL